MTPNTGNTQDELRDPSQLWSDYPDYKIGSDQLIQTKIGSDQLPKKHQSNLIYQLVIFRQKVAKEPSLSFNSEATQTHT